METGRRENAQCQGGQLDGNKAGLDGNAVDLYVEQSPSLLLSLSLSHTLTLSRSTHFYTYGTVTTKGIVNEQWPQALASIVCSK